MSFRLLQPRKLFKDQVRLNRCQLFKLTASIWLVLLIEASDDSFFEVMILQYSLFDQATVAQELNKLA